MSPIPDPALYRHNLHEVVSQCDCENWHRRNIEHRVELADGTDDRDSLEVFVEQ